MPQMLNEESDDVAVSVMSSDDDIHVLVPKKVRPGPRALKKAKAANIQAVHEKQSIEAQKQMASAAIKRNKLIEEHAQSILCEMLYIVEDF